MAEATMRRAEKLVQLATIALGNSADAEEADKAGNCLDAESAAYYDAQEALMGVIDAFLVAGFLGAGYDKENAERLAAAVPQARLPELIAKARVGAGMMDFSLA